MYYCNDCGKIFSNPKCLEECWEVDEEVVCNIKLICPRCKSDCIRDAYKCSCCKKYYSSDNLYGGYSGFSSYCKDCLNKVKDKLTIDDMLNYSKKSEVEISDFILKVLGEKQINNILNSVMKETLSTISLIEMKDRYFEDDYEMAEFIENYNKINLW